MGGIGGRLATSTTTRRGFLNSSTWVAVCSDTECKFTVPRRRAGEVVRPIPGPSAFPKWSHGERAVHELSNGEAFHFRCPDVPHPSPPSPLAPPSLIQPCLPVWPSTRFLWPPPCGMCCGGGPGEARFLCGVSSGTCVQGSWREGGNQHSDPGYGYRHAKQHRRTARGNPG